MTAPDRDLTAEEVSGALHIGLRLLYRRMKQPRPDSELTLPESSALAWIERAGPMTAAQLARQEQITPQSIAHTLAGLEQRGLVQRAPDPADGRRVMLSITDAGREAVSTKRARRSAELTAAISTNFDAHELSVLHEAAGLLERLAQVPWS